MTAGERILLVRREHVKTEKPEGTGDIPDSTRSECRCVGVLGGEQEGATKW